MQSVMQEVGFVNFPEFTGERIYMREIFKDRPLPRDLKRWQLTVNQMLEGIDTDGPLYLMVDQKIVSPNTSHRRPGIHIDGYWIPAIQAHGGGGSHVGVEESAGRHSGHGSHTGIVPERERIETEIPVGRIKHKKSPQERFNTIDPRTGKPKLKASGEWRSYWETPKLEANTPGDWRAPAWQMEVNTMKRPESIILASDVVACRALLGDWSGIVGDGGDCSHLDLSHLSERIMEAHTAYVGNVGMLHESLVLPVETKRTVVRLNVPGHIIH
jgi:hypothetical protein